MARLRTAVEADGAALREAHAKLQDMQARPARMLSMTRQHADRQTIMCIHLGEAWKARESFMH